MRHAEEVTFGGSGLDRAAHLRADPAALERLWAGTRILPLWRGKPLAVGEGRDGLGWITADHPLARGERDKALFLGCEGDEAYFAIDLSAWEPEEPAETLHQLFDPSEQRHPELPGDTAFVELRQVMTRLSPREAELAAAARALFGWHLSHRFCAKCGAESALAMGFPFAFRAGNKGFIIHDEVVHPGQVKRSPLTAQAAEGHQDPAGLVVLQVMGFHDSLYLLAGGWRPVGKAEQPVLEQGVGNTPEDVGRHG